ncbi:MAG: DUF1579 family protein [Acidobacteriota bacterium]
MVRLALSALLAALVALPAVAQPAAMTADEIIAKHIAAKGGEAALAGLEGLLLEGTYTAFSEPNSFKLWRQRPSSLRFEYSMMEAPVIDAFDGQGAWNHNPLSGVDWPIASTPPDLAAVRAIADFDTPLIGYQAKGHRIKDLQREDLDGQDTWRFDLEMAYGGEETWFLDAATFLEAGALLPMVDFGRPHRGRAYFSDFRPVGGVQIAHLVEAEFFIRHRLLEVATAVANPEIPNGAFNLPRPEEMLALADLTGDWQVEVETRPYPGADWQKAETTSAIRSRLDGGLLEEAIVLQLDGRAYSGVRSLSWDRFRERYSLSVIDNQSGHLNLQVGSRDEEDKIVLDDLATESAIGTERPTYSRTTYYEVTPDSFKVDLATSNDAGENWFHHVRLTYRRADAE